MTDFNIATALSIKFREIKKLINLFKKNIAIVIFLFVSSVLLFSSTGKTPNYGWMGTYTGNNFPSITTGLPFFRPWIYIERWNFEVFGNLWLAENFSYGIFSAFLIVKLFLDAKNGNKKFIFFILLIPLYSIIYFAAWNGPLYDILFALALIAVLDITVLLNNKTSLTQIIILAFWLSVLDLSRPIGLYFLIALIPIIFFKIKFSRFFVLFSLVAIVIGPFHFIQYKKYESISLTTYKGQNLAEVFPYFKRDCFAEFGRVGLDSPEFSKCSNQMYAEIINALVEDPKKITSAFNARRIGRIFLPNPFWHGTGIDNPQGLLFIFSKVFPFLEYLIYCAALWYFSFNCRYFIGIVFFGLGSLIVLLSHSGDEAIRVFMPFLVVLIWLPLGLDKKKNFIENELHGA